MYHDLKGLPIGLFVLLLDLIPVSDRLFATESGSKGPKIGKKVMCHDLKPIRDRSEVMNHHLEPADDRSEKTGAYSRCDEQNDGFHAWHFRCVPSVGQAMCRAENTNAETARAVSKINKCFTLNYLNNEKK